MREVVLDTETTGLSPHDGDRLVEIACITLNNHLPTGEIFHEYFNPQMPMPIAAEKIHGLTDDFLSQLNRYFLAWPKIFLTLSATTR